MYKEKKCSQARSGASLESQYFTCFRFVSHRCHVPILIQLSPHDPLGNEDGGVSAVPLDAAVLFCQGCHLFPQRAIAARVFKDLCCGPLSSWGFWNDAARSPVRHRHLRSVATIPVHELVLLEERTQHGKGGSRGEKLQQQVMAGPPVPALPILGFQALVWTQKASICPVVLSGDRNGGRKTCLLLGMWRLDTHSCKR